MRMTPGQAWALALASMASLMVALDALVVSTALSTIRLDLGASIEQLEWTVNSYNLSFAVLLMTGSALGDRFGRRRLLGYGLTLFTVASAACALSPGIGWLIAARTVQGAGAALVMPLAMAVLSTAFPPQWRGRALGIFSGVTGLAVLGGPLVGGVITQGLAWQWIFWLNVPIGLVMVPLAARRIQESHGPNTSLDLGGLLLAGAASLGLVWALVRADAAGWGSLEVVSSLLAGGVLTAAFIAWELRVPVPMLPMRLFRSASFSAGNAMAFLQTASLFGSLFFLAQYLQIPLGYRPLDAGLRLLPWTATLFFVAPIAGSLVDRIGERFLAALGLLLQAAGFAWIALIAEPDLAYPHLILPLVISGCGISMAMPASQNAVLSSVSPADVGTASGTYNMLRQLGGVFGIALMATVFSATGGYTDHQAFSDGFSPAMTVAAALSLVGAVSALGTAAKTSAPSALSAVEQPA
jgi:EmrB/QacA subfamily drug resistance transporter